MIFEKSAFDIARENIRQIVNYIRNDLLVPTEMIKVQLEAIIQGLIIQEQMRNDSIRK